MSLSRGLACLNLFLLTSHEALFNRSLLQMPSGRGCGPGGSEHQLESQKLQAKNLFITHDCEWRHEGCFILVENNLSEQGENKQPKLSGKAFSCTVRWLYTSCWKFGWTGWIKTLKHQIWRECSTGCWGDSSLVLPHVFPSVGFCDYMWLPHSLQHIRTCRRTVYLLS